MQIVMDNQQNKITVTPLHEKVIRLIGQIVALKFALTVETEVSLTFGDDSFLQNLNKTYRGLDEPTDVLSFAFAEEVEGVKFPQITGEGGVFLLGEIVLSLERVQQQAIEYEHSFVKELAFLTIHGLLHLLGYDHQEEKDTAEMRKKEQEILASLAERISFHAEVF